MNWNKIWFIGAGPGYPAGPVCRRQDPGLPRRVTAPGKICPGLFLYRQGHGILKKQHGSIEIGGKELHIDQRLKTAKGFCPLQAGQPPIHSFYHGGSHGDQIQQKQAQP